MAVGNVVDEDGKTVYIVSGNSGSYSYTGARAEPDDPIAVGLRAHYNQEAITITMVSGSAGATLDGTIEWIGNNRVAANSVHAE